MNFGAALSPFVLGALADAAGTPVAIWVCVGISFLAALINVPLLWVKGCNVPPKPRPAELRALRGEDKEMVEKALRGEWIPAAELEAINEHRFQNGQPYLLIHPRSYEDEKDDLHALRRRAKEDFLFHSEMAKKYLHDIKTVDDLGPLCNQVNASLIGSDENEVDQINQEMGEWFKDYLVGSGYAVSSTHPYFPSCCILHNE